MTDVILPCGRPFLIDEDDLPILAGRYWHADRRSNTLYVRGRFPGESKGGVYLHHLLMGGLADHIDGDGLNNLRSNLRRCTQAQNGLNRGPKAGKRFKGVYPRGARFYAQIYLHRRAYTSHGHLTAEDAARAYDRMAVELHGEFARLNFPTSEAT